MSVNVSADVLTIVDMALKASANVDVIFEVDGDVRVNIYPVEAAISDQPTAGDQGEANQA